MGLFLQAHEPITQASAHEALLFPIFQTLHFPLFIKRQFLHLCEVVTYLSSKLKSQPTFKILMNPKAHKYTSGLSRLLKFLR